MAAKKTPICQFRDRLRDERTRRGWSQAELAARLAQQREPISQSVLSKMESAGREPRPDELVAIARVFGLTVDSLLGYKGGQPDGLDYAMRSLRDVARRSAVEIKRAANELDVAEAEVFGYMFSGNLELARWFTAFHRHITIALVALRVTELLTDIDVASANGFDVRKDPVPAAQIRAEVDEARRELARAKKKFTADMDAAPNGKDVLSQIAAHMIAELFPEDAAQLAEAATAAEFLSEFVLPQAGL